MQAELGPLGVLLTRRGKAIRQEEDDRQSLLRARQPERFRQRALDVGAPFGVELIHPALRLVHFRRSRKRPPVVIDRDAAAEGNQPEPVRLVERSQELPKGRAGLCDLGSGHGARNIHHRGDVARLGGAGHRPRRERQHEIAVLAGRPVGRQGESHGRAGEREEERKVAGQSISGAHDETPAHVMFQ